MEQHGLTPASARGISLPYSVYRLSAHPSRAIIGLKFNHKKCFILCDAKTVARSIKIFAALPLYVAFSFFEK
jgi:hypothetical protein